LNAGVRTKFLCRGKGFWDFDYIDWYQNVAMLCDPMTHVR